MCWLVIRARSNPKATAYKAGDIVEIRPDDCNWGNLETLPRFYRIQITDMPFGSRFQSLCQRKDDVDDGFDDDGKIKKRLLRIRKHKIDLSSIPASIRNRLQDTGVATVTRSQIRNHFKDNQGTVIDIDSE